MKTLRALPLLLLLCVSLAAAQSGNTTRVLVLPFDAATAFSNYGLGVATAVQRALNTIDGVYAPPVGDGALFVRRAFEAGEADSLETARAAFAADFVVSGAVQGGGEGLRITLAFRGAGGEASQVAVTSGSDPAAAVQAVLDAVVEELRLALSQSDRQELAKLAAQTPSLPSLAPAARAASRLSADLVDLAGAAELDPGSGWVLAEYARALALHGQPEQGLAQSQRALAASRDVEALVVRGVILLELERNEEALAIFEEAARLNPSHALALAGVAAATTDAARARDALTKAVDSYPRLVDAQLRLAAIEGSDQRALQNLRRAAEHLPESVALHRAFAARALSAGDARGALAYLQQAAGRPLAASPALYAIAADLPESVAEEALAFVRSGAERFPDSTLPKLAEAELLRRLGRAEEAEALLMEARAAHPSDPEVANQLAITQAQLGKVAEARATFESIAGDSPTVAYNLAQLLLQAGQARGAVEVLAPLVEAGAADAETHALYGTALGRAGRTTEGVAALDRALELDPDLRQARAARDLLEQQRSITGEATMTLEGEAAGAFERGMAALERRDAATAATEFGRARELADQPLLAFYHGFALQLAGDLRAAVPAYQAALEGFPESDIVLNNLGYAQLALGRFDLALGTLRDAVRANPENAQAQLNLGLTFYGLRRWDDALAAWDAAVRLEPNLEQAIAELRQAAERQSGR